MEETPLLSLQPDSLIQIFHKLPVRSLLQCKLVCKEWFSLLSDPLFKSNYNSVSVPNHPLNLMMIPIPRYVGKVGSAALTYEIDRFDNRVLRSHQPLPGNNSSETHKFTILGSWNGLVALCHDDGVFYLLNPCTGEVKSVHVDLDPDTLWHKDLCGLSYDSSSREYKAVLSVGYRTDSLYVVSFKHGEWKLKTEMEQFESYRNPGTIINGVPHWIVSGDRLCYFDHNKEEIREMPKPREWYQKVLCGLGALDGKLTVAINQREGVWGDIGRGLKVWVLRDFSNPESWICLFSIVNKLYSVSILSSMNDDEVLMDLQSELMIYNHKNHSIRRLEPSRPKMKRRLYEIVTYYPSVISPTTT